MPHGSPEGLDFTNIYFYTVTWHALHTSMQLARERGQRFAGFERSRYASGAYFDKYLPGGGSRKPNGCARCSPAPASLCPTGKAGASCADDVMRYGIYNRYLLGGAAQPA
ncbi:hypothetical protein LNQ03_24915 [Klebsiella pneumoniae subsp. pneumoniae]|nr:hypothetical protein [Klebsiella pneumoniae subsp. pneumoniae]